MIRCNGRTLGKFMPFEKMTYASHPIVFEYLKAARDLGVIPRDVDEVQTGPDVSQWLIGDRTLKQYVVDAVDDEEHAIRKSGRRMAGDRLDRLKDLHDDLADLIGELEPGSPPADDDDDEGAETGAKETTTKMTKANTTTTRAPTPDEVATAMVALAKSRSTASGRPASQEYADLLAENDSALYNAFEQVSRPLTPVQKAAAAMTAPEETQFEAFTKAAKAPRPGDSRTPFQALSDFYNSPEGREAYARYDELHG